MSASNAYTDTPAPSTPPTGYTQPMPPRPPAHGRRPLTPRVRRDLLRDLRRIDHYRALLQPDSGATIAERQTARRKLEAARYRRDMILSGYAVGSLVDRYGPEDGAQTRETTPPRVEPTVPRSGPLRRLWAVLMRLWTSRRSVRA